MVLPERWGNEGNCGLTVDCCSLSKESWIGRRRRAACYIVFPLSFCFYPPGWKGESAGSSAYLLMGDTFAENRVREKWCYNITIKLERRGKGENLPQSYSAGLGASETIFCVVCCFASAPNKSLPRWQWKWKGLFRTTKQTTTAVPLLSWLLGPKEAIGSVLRKCKYLLPREEGETTIRKQKQSLIRKQDFFLSLHLLNEKNGTFFCFFAGNSYPANN